MTIPSDKISFSLINTELGRQSTNPFDIDDSDGRDLASVGQNGAQTTKKTPISFSQFREHAYARFNYNSTVTDTIISTSSYNSGKTFGNVTIGTEGILGASAAQNYGMKIQGSSGDKIVIRNSGAIVGAGGNGGYTSTRGLDGGPALLIQGTTTILYNVGTIGGGGGGGGGGGDYEDSQTPREHSNGNGGGGGAGYIVGIGGGTGGASRTYRPQPGQNGSLYIGGNAGAGNTLPGGKGGNLGQGGGAGAGGGGASLPGAGIQGSSYLQIVQNGTIAGPIS